MAKTLVFEEQICLRFSSRVLSRVRRVVKERDQDVSEFIRQATIRAVEKAEREGVGTAAGEDGHNG